MRCSSADDGRPEAEAGGTPRALSRGRLDGGGWGGSWTGAGRGAGGLADALGVRREKRGSGASMS